MMFLADYSAPFQCKFVRRSVRTTPFVIRNDEQTLPLPLSASGEPAHVTAVFPWRRGPHPDVRATSDQSDGALFVLDAWARADEPAWLPEDFDQEALQWVFERSLLAIILVRGGPIDWPPIGLKIQSELRGYGRVLILLVEPLVADEWLDFILPRLPGAAETVILWPPAPGKPARRLH